MVYAIWLIQSIFANRTDWEKKASLSAKNLWICDCEYSMVM